MGYHVLSHSGGPFLTHVHTFGPECDQYLPKAGLRSGPHGGNGSEEV